MRTPPERVLLDTNVLVHLIRGDQVGQRVATDHGLRERAERPLISVITVGELRALAMKRSWQAAKQEKLDELVRELVIVRPDQGSVIQKYAEIYTYCERDLQPARPMGQNDMWIAATAAASDARLLTTDSDFDHLNPGLIHLSRLDATTGATLP